MKLFLMCVTVFLVISFPVKAGTGEDSVVIKNLNSGWQFSNSDSAAWYPASVPGCIHTDLMNNHLIGDPYYRTNERDLQWIGKDDWDYKKEFNLPADFISKKNIELVFNGLDTYADVYLNDSLVLSADNMFRVWVIPCKELLKEKGNVLSIHFNNVFKVNLPKWKSAPYRLAAFPNNDQADTMIAMYSRKAQFHYGWDWGPRLITCGIWRDVSLEGWDNFKIDNVQVIQKNVSRDKADISSFINVRSSTAGNITASVKVDGKTYSVVNYILSKGENKIPINFEIINPDLWWTNGLGTHYLYNFEFTVAGDSGSIDSKKIKIGIRSLEVVRTKDTAGESFYIKLNGVPVFMKGANYIPQDNFQNRVTLERYEHMIKSAADAHMNILRVWGGGIYENNEFYDLCDQYGILVWQEFAFACAMYPSDSLFPGNVKHEIQENVVRLRNHACLALYCGNNENEISWYQWGWKENYSPEIQKEYESGMYNLFNVLIPDLLRQYDSTRYYHYTSPSAGFNGIPPSDGDIHYWGVWHGKEPFSDFNKNIARFVSEYGFQSYPELSTIKKYAAPEDMNLHSAVMLSHQRCMSDERKDKEYGNRLIQLYMDRQYKEPKDFESFIYVSQVLQAEGDKIAIEAHRRNMPYCMGTMYWQIDDCWPAASWSSIDYFGNWKALHYYVKREYQTFLISNILKDDSLHFYIISDSLADAPAQITIKTVDFSGKIIFNKAVNLNLKSDCSIDYFSIAEKDLTEGGGESNIVVVSRLTSGNKILCENKFFFKDPKDLNLEKPDIKINVQKNDDGYELTLTSDKFAKDVYLNFKNRDGFFTDNYFDLLPGVAKTIEYRTKNRIDDILNKLKVISLADSYKN